jgi:hypothetical protein
MEWMNDFTGNGPNGKEQTFNFSDLKDGTYKFCGTADLSKIIKMLLEQRRIKINEEYSSGRITEYDYIPSKGYEKLRKRLS